jgi:hypothetical protein
MDEIIAKVPRHVRCAYGAALIAALLIGLAITGGGLRESFPGP